MPLHLNLYHEVHKQKALQRRDPLKFAAAGLAVVALSLAGYYLLEWNSQRSVTNELARLEAEYSTFSKKAAASKQRTDEAAETLKISDLLVKRMEQRFYWAPILASIAQTVPNEVQITKFAGDIANDGSNRCSLTIEGVAAGGDPRKVAEELRRSLGEQFSTKYKAVNAKFRALEDAPSTVTLNGQKFPAANFGITVVMQVGDAASPASSDPAQASAQTASK